MRKSREEAKTERQKCREISQAAEEEAKQMCDNVESYKKLLMQYAKRICI